MFQKLETTNKVTAIFYLLVLFFLKTLESFAADTIV